MRLPFEPTKRIIKDYGIAVIAAILLAFLIRTFLAEAYRIPSSAMRPTLEAGDTVFAHKWNFLFGSVSNKIRRGDVIIFASPKDLRIEYVKRVVALPGEIVEVRNNQLHINGAPVVTHLPEHKTCGTETLSDAVTHGICVEPPNLPHFGPETVPQNAVFVLGDFRNEVQTPQSWGIIPTQSIRAKVSWIWLSIAPRTLGAAPFPQFRFERMFRRIE